MRILILILTTLLISSCNAQDDVKIKLAIHNKSGKTLDSIKVYNFFNEYITYYNVKPGSIIEKTYTNKTSMLPKGESSVFHLYAFDKEKYYSMETGFIGFPTARLEDEYSFFIRDTYISTKENAIPKKNYGDQRRPINEFKEMDSLTKAEYNYKELKE